MRNSGTTKYNKCSHDTQSKSNLLDAAEPKCWRRRKRTLKKKISATTPQKSPPLKWRVWRVFCWKGNNFFLHTYEFILKTDLRHYDIEKWRHTINKKIWTSGPEVQILSGWPANPTKSGPKKQKRGLVSSLDSLNLELFGLFFAKKSQKTPKIELRQPPT